ncbi:MAG: YihY/virulence factor BrkB family protein [Candidatus Omnitrophica bacterium]|nr:YihY/virulence factor BrkB family protein [Candidatus Omnitrophota bacterium]
MIKKTLDFINEDIWRIKADKLPRKRSFFITQLRIFLLAIRGFYEDKCQLRAAALTYYLLLSIVPMLAVVFGIAKGFGLEKTLETQLLERFSRHGEVVVRIINFANALLERTRGGMIAGIGVIILFWTVIKVLTNVERSFDDIWGVKKMRSFVRRFSDYISIMLVCPILLIISGSITVFLSTQLKMIVSRIHFLADISGFIFFVLGLLPYCIIWVLFTFIYIFIPNTRVNFRSALLGGIIGGTIYEMVQWLYINFQIGVAKINAIYGSFAALPLFLVWLHTSWLVLLFGAELAFAHQNVHTYEFEQDCLKVSHSFKMLVSLLVAALLVKRFVKAEKPLSAVEVSRYLEIPIRLTRDVLNSLREAGIIIEIKSEDERTLLYQPAQDVDRLNIRYVVEQLERYGVDNIPVIQTAEMTKLSDSLNKLREITEKSPANLLLKDL